jgi:cytochrome P450
MNHEPEIYGGIAADFDPARRVDANRDIPPGPPNTKGEGHVTYSFGRRLCVSQYVADNSLFIKIAALLVL